MKNLQENSKERVIEFLSIPNFMAEIELVKNPELKKRAFVITPLKSDSAKIWEASSSAQSSGIQKGMDLAMARRLCRGLEVLNPNPDLYQSVHKKILFKMSRLTPLLEEEKFGQIYLDFSGFDKLYGDSASFGKRMIEELRGDFKLSPRLGIANNKLIAKAATNTKLIHEDIYKVSGHSLINFLDPFPNDELPVVKEFMKKKQNPLSNLFEDLNLKTVFDLKRLDLITLKAFFLDQSLVIYDMARGFDNRPVLTALMEPTIALDLHIEEQNNRGLILNLLYGLADKVFFELRKEGKSCRKIKLAIRYADFKYLDKIICLSFSVQYAHEVYVELEKALGFLFGRRVSVRYLFIELKDLHVEGVQLGLFEDPQKKIFDNLDKINMRFPQKVLMGRNKL